MRISLILLFAVVLQLPAENVYAQRTRTSFSMSNVSVEQVLNRIEETSDYVFLYNNKTIQTSRIVSVSNNSGKIMDILDAIFNGTNVTYTVMDKQIILSTKQIAQQDPQIQVSGIVKDGMGEPLIGVNIKVKGAPSGAITDINGQFTLQVKKDDVLEISYVGYTTKTVKIINDQPLNIILEEDAQSLNEVVVTALGIKRAEKALSYNVQQIKQDEIVRVKDANFVNSLSGKIAGVNINKSSAGVGGAARVVMRGAKSIEGDNNVLYVIDGMPLFNYSRGSDSGIMGEGSAGTEGIADFNPEDIESLSVLAGPSAAALYGSSAANGAILITKKKGKEGKMQISFSSSAEFSRPLMTPKFQNTYGNKPGEYASWGAKLATPSSYDPADDFFNTGTNFINSLTLTTGNEFNQTFASVASTNSKGIVPNNTYDRLNFTIRNTSKLFDGKVQLDLGASYVKQKDNNMISQGQYYNPIVAAYLFPRGEDFEAIKTFETYDTGRNFATQYWPLSDGQFANQNPYWTAYRNLFPNNKSRYMFNAGLTYNILDWLSVAGRVRFDNSYVASERKFYASTYSTFADTQGKYVYDDYKDYQTYADAIVNINKSFGDFNLMANVGYSYSEFGSLKRGYGGNLATLPNGFFINNIASAAGMASEEGGDSKVANVAAFASMELGWRSMLYLTLTGRNDWNSRQVNSKEESFFYPSVGLSAIVSEMVDLPRFISYLKVRGSFTEVGAPIAKSGMTPGTITTPIVGGVLQPTHIYPYSDYKAERTKSYEFGLTARFLNKFNFDFTWYKSNTYNQTFIGELPESSGYKQVYLQAGNVENRGVEMSLGYNDTFGDFSVSSSLTFTKNTNEIKEMVENYEHPLSLEPINVPEVLKDNGRVILKVGGTINDIYANKFLKKDNQGYVNVTDKGEIMLETTDPVYLGKTTPDFTMGWNNSFNYKGFGLSFLVNARFGGVVTSSTQAILDRFGVSQASADARDNGGVMLPNQGRYDAKKYYELIGTGNNDLAGYYTYSATNIRLQELTLSYTFPNSWFNGIARDLTLSFIATNPWMIYCKAPYDLELTPSTSTYGQGNDYFMQPSVRSFGFGVKVKF